MILSVVAVIVIAYLLGNLNGAIFTSRYFAHEDVRQREAVTQVLPIS